MVRQLKPPHVSKQGSASWNVQPLSSREAQDAGKSHCGPVEVHVGNQPGGILDIFSGSVSWFEKTLDEYFSICKVGYKPYGPWPNFWKKQQENLLHGFLIRHQSHLHKGCRSLLSHPGLVCQCRYFHRERCGLGSSAASDPRLWWMSSSASCVTRWGICSWLPSNLRGLFALETKAKGRRQQMVNVLQP